MYHHVEAGRGEIRSLLGARVHVKVVCMAVFPGFRRASRVHIIIDHQASEIKRETLGCLVRRGGVFDQQCTTTGIRASMVESHRTASSSIAQGALGGILGNRPHRHRTRSALPGLANTSVLPDRTPYNFSRMRRCFSIETNRAGIIGYGRGSAVAFVVCVQW